VVKLRMSSFVIVPRPYLLKINNIEEPKGMSRFLQEKRYPFHPNVFS
jgi:hypothetical protein